MKTLRTTLGTASLGLALITAAFSAHAIEYTQVQAGQSNVGFSYQQMGVKMDGQFKKFAATLNFDPAQPASAKASFEVDLASVDSGSSEADQELAGKPWFNTRLFPSARFVSTSVKALGGNRYEVLGQLSIKGKTLEVVVPATFTPQGKQAVFDGSFTIRRGDFAIGEGSWAKFDIVANDVLIKFHLATSGK